MRDGRMSSLRRAVRVPGHFGEWMQGRLGREGPVALVTLCCPALGVRGPGGPVRLADLFPETQLAGFAAALGIAGDWPGLACDMPLGAGAGASTACLVAAARACGFDGTAGRLARACLAVEGATDPLMYPAPDRLLWASREARIMADLPTVPRAEIPAEIPLDIGTQLQVQTPQGQVMPVTVAEVTESEVTLDANHPLAGRDLTFAIELVSIG